MRILAIDTSCGAASAAVVERGQIEPLVAETRVMARGQAEALVPMVEDAMARIERGAASLDRIAVTTGPGSFTGIRVGVALARAMGLALGVPVVGVSTLAAFAASLLATPRPFPAVRAFGTAARAAALRYASRMRARDRLGSRAARGRRCNGACRRSPPGRTAL